MENHNFLMGKSTINGPCSIAMLDYRRVLYINLVGGLEHNCYLSIQLRRKIPTDELHHVSEGLVETTNQKLYNNINFLGQSFNHHY